MTWKMEWPDGWLPSQKGGYVLWCSAPERESPLHQLTIHNRIKYPFLRLEEPRGLVACLGAKINRKEYTPLGQTKLMNPTQGKAKHFHEGSIFFPCLLNEDLDSSHGVHCRHGQSPAPIPSAHTIPRYASHFLRGAPEKCSQRSFSGCWSLAQTHLDREVAVQEAISRSNPQPMTDGSWCLKIHFLALWVGYLCSGPSHTGPRCPQQ